MEYIGRRGKAVILHKTFPMKPLLPFLFAFVAGLPAKAQHVGGLWQGKWSSPEGYVFDFVLHLDEFTDGSVSGFLSWTFVQAPENDGYYKNRQGQEAIEYVEGKIEQKGSVRFEGVRKDDPLLIISLDKYRLTFDEAFTHFTGNTGHHGSWTGKIEGVRIGIP